MKTPLEQLIEAVKGERVFGAPLDDIIRHVSDEVTAHTFLDACGICDLNDPEWPAVLARELNRRSAHNPQDELIDVEDPSDEALSGGKREDYDVFLKLNFRSEDASFYQFDLFPNMNKSYIKDYEKLKVGISHYLRLKLQSKRDLELFVRSLRNNHHLKSVEKIDAEEFNLVEAS